MKALAPSSPFGGDAVSVTPQGRYFLRAIAMVFDRHVAAGRARSGFSKLI